MEKKSWFDKVDNGIFKTLKCVSYAATVFLAAMMVLAVVNVVLEKLKKIGVPVEGIGDTPNWIMFMNIGVVFLASAYVTLERGHSGVDLLTRHYPKIVQEVLSALSHLAGFVVFVFVSYLGYIKVLIPQLENNARINDTLASSFPQWPFGALYIFGMALLAFSQLWGVVRVCMGRPAASDAANLEKESKELLAQAREAIGPNTEKQTGKEGE